MKEYTYFQAFDTIEYEHSIECPDPKRVRISPRSYRHGETNGWLCGLTVGFMAGLLFGLFLMTNIIS